MVNTITILPKIIEKIMEKNEEDIRGTRKILTQFCEYLLWRFKTKGLSWSFV